MLPSENLTENQPVSINCIGGLAAVIDSKAAYRSSRLPAFEGGGGKNGAGPKPSALGGLVFITATGFLGVLTGCGTVGGVEWGLGWREGSLSSWLDVVVLELRPRPQKN